MTVAVEPTATAQPSRRARRSWVRRRPAASLAVTLVALVNGLAWSLIVPPFHVPDEAAHVYYAQYLTETGELPTKSPNAAWYSDDLNAVLGAQSFYLVVGTAANRPPVGAAAAQQLDQALQLGRDRVGVGDAASATTNPPGYYLLEAPVYAAAKGADVLDRLALMRLVSVLLGALTALCTWCFLRELLPATPLAWTVGALAVALQPAFAFMTSGVNNDAGLYLASALLFLTIARLLRRGLSARRVVAVGAVLAGGVLVKTQMLTFAPAVGAAVLLAASRARRAGASTRELRRSLGVAAGAAAVPLLIYTALGVTLWQRPTLDRVSAVSAASANAKPFIWREQLSFLWEEYLPRLPFMKDLLPGVPGYDLWFRGLVGRFGWLDYSFSPAFARLAGAVWILVGLAAALHLWRRRDAVRRRAGELLVYALLSAGLATAIAVISYRTLINDGGQFEQARYLLPLLPLYGAVAALAVRAGGRFAGVIAVLLVVGAAGHNLFAQLITLSRYYG